MFAVAESAGAWSIDPHDHFSLISGTLPTIKSTGRSVAFQLHHINSRFKTRLGMGKWFTFLRANTFGLLSSHISAHNPTSISKDYKEEATNWGWMEGFLSALLTICPSKKGLSYGDSVIDRLIGWLIRFIHSFVPSKNAKQEWIPQSVIEGRCSGAQAMNEEFSRLPPMKIPLEKMDCIMVDEHWDSNLAPPYSEWSSEGRMWNWMNEWIGLQNPWQYWFPLRRSLWEHYSGRKDSF